MIASSPSSRSITVSTPQPNRPRVIDGRGRRPAVSAAEGRRGSIDAFVGGLLELVVHSIEGMREHFGQLTLRLTD